jgi:hypothetical protein
MTRVYRWDGKEIFINPDNILFVEFMAGGGYDKDYTQVIMSDGETYRLSSTGYEILTGQNGRKNTPGKAGFDVL